MHYKLIVCHKCVIKYIVVYRKVVHSCLFRMKDKYNMYVILN